MFFIDNPLISQYNQISGGVCVRITNESDYALRILYELSKANIDTQHSSVASAADISEQTGVSLRFSLKILRKLSIAGIVASKKGASGGYYLARDPSDISLGEIIEVIEGQIRISNCTQDEYTCPRACDDHDPCRYHSIFCSLTQRFRQELYSIKLSDVLYAEEN